MVRFDRLDTEKARSAVRSLEREQKRNGDCNTPEVMSALQEMFHGKCYICENKKRITSFQVEHLKPHQGNMADKYSWDNIFLSCSHCNNTKGNRYVPILDCTHVDVDQRISFHFLNPLQNEREIMLEALDDTVETRNTCSLLMNVYYGKTPQKEMESRLIRCELRRQIMEFMAYVREYLDTEEGEDKRDLLCKIKQELSNRSEYTAFKRWVILDNLDMCGELAPLLRSITLNQVMGHANEENK